MDTRTGEIISEEQAVMLRMKYGDDSAMEMNVPPTRKQVRLGKVGRNELCPCGSGKKFKHCHKK